MEVACRSKMVAARGGTAAAPPPGRAFRGYSPDMSSWVRAAGKGFSGAKALLASLLVAMATTP